MLVAAAVTSDGDTSLWKDVIAKVKQDTTIEAEAIDLALDLFVG